MLTNVCLTRLSGAAEQAAPQVRAAIARGARAGLPPARLREVEARLRQRDAAAAESLFSCAGATPFSMAAYQDALDIAARFELCECYPSSRIKSTSQASLAYAQHASHHDMQKKISLHQHILDRSRDHKLALTPCHVNCPHVMPCVQLTRVRHARALWRSAGRMLPKL